jgi:hypothetical protein
MSIQFFLKTWCDSCKLGETIEQPCSVVLAHTLKVCRGAHLHNEYLAIRDGHDS